MAIWVIRGGKHGEFEQKFIQENKVYVTWDGLDVNIAKMKDREELVKALMEIHPDDKSKTITNWVSQVWPFAHEINKGDLVLLPLKSQRPSKLDK
jgi:restriction system protein